MKKKQCIDCGHSFRQIKPYYKSCDGCFLRRMRVAQGKCGICGLQKGYQNQTLNYFGIYKCSCAESKELNDPNCYDEEPY